MKMLPSFKFIVAALGTLASFPMLRALEFPYDFHVKLTPENVALGHFPAAKTPILTVKSGAIVRIDGGGGARAGGNGELSVESVDAWLKENHVPTTVAENVCLQETIKVLKETRNRLPPAPGAPAGAGGGGGHMLVGPIYIEDAEPGDSLEIRILDITPRIPFGTTGASPGRGGLALGMAASPTPGASAPATASVPRPFAKVTLLDLKRNAGVFGHNIEVPLAPFMGVMATCPPDSEGPNRRSSAPGSFGGNLDCKDLVTGTTLYLPIFQKGALFYTGDSHAAQGDGEVTGSAIETANTCILQFILHKGTKLAMPRAETPTHYVTFGLDPDLNLAMKQAITETIEFLKEKKGLDFFQSFPLASIAIDYRVTQVVDRTLGIHGMISKKLFVSDPDNYWYRAH